VPGADRSPVYPDIWISDADGNAVIPVEVKITGVWVHQAGVKTLVDVKGGDVRSSIDLHVDGADVGQAMSLPELWNLAEKEKYVEGRQVLARNRSAPITQAYTYMKASELTYGILTTGFWTYLLMADVENDILYASPPLPARSAEHMASTPQAASLAQILVWFFMMARDKCEAARLALGVRVDTTKTYRELIRRSSGSLSRSRSDANRTARQGGLGSNRTGKGTGSRQSGSGHTRGVLQANGQPNWMQELDLDCGVDQVIQRHDKGLTYRKYLWLGRDNTPTGSAAAAAAAAGDDDSETIDDASMPVVVKMTSYKDRHKLEEIRHERDVYEAIGDLQGDVVPRVVWTGDLIADRYVVATEDAGESLLKWKPPSRQVAMAVAREAVAKLEVLHSRGVLHGDIASRNMTVDVDNHVKFIDFGYASAEGLPQPDHVARDNISCATERADLLVWLCDALGGGVVNEALGET
jgi:hypothetical protein